MISLPPTLGSKSSHSSFQTASPSEAIHSAASKTILGGERVSYCAAADGAVLPSRGTSPPNFGTCWYAPRATVAPDLFFQAENDYDLAPSHTLVSAMREAGKIADIKIYPPFGASKADGHNFAWHGSSVWGNDVIAFLERHCDKVP